MTCSGGDAPNIEIIEIDGTHTTLLIRSLSAIWQSLLAEPAIGV